MINYLLRKLAIFLLSLFLVITLTFFLMKAIPGDPFIQEKVIPQEILDALYKYYGLDKPIWIQYFTYIKGLFQGHLPPSMVYEGRHLLEFIKEGFPISATLGIEALIISTIFGISIGSIGAFYRGRWQGQLAIFIGIIGISIPSFLLATLFQYVLSIKTSLLPVARWESFSHSILPAISIAALPTAFIARLTRASMIDVYQQGYIKTAYAKGLSSFQVFRKHVLRNSISPVLAYMGPICAHILTGSFIIEKIFAIPGLGQWFVSSILNRDYPIIMGLTIFYSSLLLGSVLIVDLILPLIDPRMEVAKR